MVIDLFTLDVPEGADWLINVVRSQVACGATAVALLHGGLLRFECPAVSMKSWFKQQPDSVASRGPFLSASTSQPLDAAARRVLKSGCALRRSATKTTTNEGASSATGGPHIRFHQRPGLVLLPRRLDVEQRQQQMAHHTSTNPASGASSLLFCYIVLTSQNFDFLENDFAPVGQVREGAQALQRMKYRCPSGSAASSSSELVTPTRLIRVKDAAVLTSSASSSSSSSVMATALNTAALATAAAVTEDHDNVASTHHEQNFVIIEATEHTKKQTSTHFVLPCAIRYNAHYHGGFLSSDDDDNPNQPVDDAEVALHQRKLDETRSLMLNVLDGITDTDLKAPETVLFVCKLNPLTTSEGLATCFSQFGKVLSSEVLKDPKGNSRCYAFVEFAEKASCDRAVQKMDKALIDDCRIHVDFSQSVSKAWASTAQAKRRLSSSSFTTKRARD